MFSAFFETTIFSSYDALCYAYSYFTVVYAGIAPEGWDHEMPRQANESTENLMNPPVPVKDPYGWLRDDKRDNKEIVQYLEAENNYSQKMTAHLKGLQDELYQEFLSSIKETDFTTPRPRKNFWYYSRTFEGKSYCQYCRSNMLLAHGSLA